MTTEQMVRIAFTHDELRDLLDGVESGMETVNELAGIIGIQVSDELRVFHMRLKWAHALVCQSAPSPSEVFAAMPMSVAERLTLDQFNNFHTGYTGPHLTNGDEPMARRFDGATAAERI